MPEELARGLRGEHRGLLVPHVDQPHACRALDRGVVQREHVRAGEGEHRLDTVGAGHRGGVVAAVPLEVRAHGAKGTGAGSAVGRVR